MLRHRKVRLLSEIAESVIDRDLHHQALWVEAPPSRPPGEVSPHLHQPPSTEAAFLLVALVGDGAVRGLSVLTCGLGCGVRRSSAQCGDAPGLLQNLLPVSQSGQPVHPH